MSTRVKFLSTAVVLGAAAASVGCQTYDFEPVDPIAIAQTTQSKTVISRQQKPNMMIVLDKSGSMNFAADPTVAGCAGCATTSCVGTACSRTRMWDLRDAMNTFLTGAGSTVARMGLLPFPSNAACGAASISPFPATGVELNQSNDVSADLSITAGEINTKIQTQITPSGGTPTALSLQALEGYARLQDQNRQNFILLLTDGSPNCNPVNDPNTCKCTSTGVTPCSSSGNNLCLDKDGLVAEVAALRAKGIQTIVVGFGAEAAAATGDAADVLTSAAIAGGRERTCPKGTDAECGGTAGSCVQSTLKCTYAYYKAADGPALAAALAAIGSMVGNADPCAYTLDATPSDPKFLSVIFDGASIPSGADSWTYDPTGSKVVFKGTYCDKLTNATPGQPVKVEFRIVEGL